MSGAPFRVETPADLARAIELAEAQGAIGFACLCRALLAGRIAFQPLFPGAAASRFKAFVRATRDRPAVVTIGDDDGLDLGPAGWPLAWRAITWAKETLH